MKIEVSVKTITEVEKTTGVFLIRCFSDMNEDGTTTPVIFKSQILDSPMEIDGVNGKEGELMLSHSGEESGSFNSNGELVISISNDVDKVHRYSMNNENLMYEQVEGDDNNYEPESYEPESYS